MDNLNFFKDFFESIPDYRKIVLILFLIKNDKNFLLEIGYSERDIDRLNLEFKNILMEEYANYLDYINYQEESILRKVFE